MLVRFRWASVVIDCWAYNGAQTGNGHGSNHSMVIARLRLSMATALLSNCLAKISMAKLKTAVVKKLLLELRNRYRGLELNEDVSMEDEWRELKNAFAKASQACFGKTHSRRWGWVTVETRALAE